LTFADRDVQLYHSIHAKGENVEDVLREAEAADQAEAEAAAAIGGAGSWTRVDVENDDDLADAEPATAAQVPEVCSHALLDASQIEY
jgi:hypothetical protein